MAVATPANTQPPSRQNPGASSLAASGEAGASKDVVQRPTLSRVFAQKVMRLSGPTPSIPPSKSLRLAKRRVARLPPDGTRAICQNLSRAAWCHSLTGRHLRARCWHPLFVNPSPGPPARLAGGRSPGDEIMRALTSPNQTPFQACTCCALSGGQTAPKNIHRAGLGGCLPPMAVYPGHEPTPSRNMDSQCAQRTAPSIREDLSCMGYLCSKRVWASTPATTLLQFPAYPP